MMSILSQPSTTIKNKTGGWRTFKPVTDYAKCIGCGTCAKVCPESCIAMLVTDTKKKQPRTDYDFCKGCGLCAAECPVKCIEMIREDK